MEEEGAPKVAAPVTRLRRRISLEVDDVGSPSTPSTPNKKRGGKLAAKPLLDNIDENASITPAKRGGRKSIAKDVADSDKVLTPSRRSTRIKSNTSITSETVQSCDTPRAKRAARRISQIDSDNEAPITPVRQTRKTRKDSTSSVENMGEAAPDTKPAVPVIKEIIAEDREEEKNTPEKLTKNIDKSSPNSLRKSQRLGSKKNANASNTSIQDQKTDKSLTGADAMMEEADLKPDPKETSQTKSAEQKKNRRSKSLNSTHESINDISLNSSIGEKNKRKKSLTKSLDLRDLTQETISDLMAEDKENFESIFIAHAKEKDVNQSQIKDNLKNESSASLEKVNDDAIDSISQDLSDKQNLPMFFQPAENKTVNCSVCIEDTDNLEKVLSTEIKNVDDQCVPVVNARDILEENNKEHTVVETNYIPLESIKNAINDSCEPMDIDETMPENVSINDSKSKNKSQLAVNSKVKDTSVNKSKRKSSSSHSLSEENEKAFNNKSTLILSQLKDDSSINKSASDSIKVSESQINLKHDSIGSEMTVINKKLHIDSVDGNDTPTRQNNTKVGIQTSTPVALNMKTKVKKQNDSKLSKKTLKSSSEDEDSNNVRNQNYETKIKKNTNGSILSRESPSVNEDKSSSEEESSDEDDKSAAENSLIDAGAEDAGEDYESGDSRDDSERRYEEENEIQENGESLTNDEEELSDNSDYEKDSFVVSSDEEDDELLSGSNDDLDFSDKDLTMSAKSKKKFNERKLKEQKKASREMFEARHGTKSSKIKKKRQVIDSQSDSEMASNESPNASEIDERKCDKTDKPKKKRLRLDSSEIIGDVDKDVQIKPKKQRLNSTQDELDASELKPAKASNKNMSGVDLALNEAEMTALCDISTVITDDPLITAVKQEPKTPLKGLDMSTVNISVRQDVEEVQIDENADITKRNNETSDPLNEASESDDDLSSISENEEIKQNYESLLNDLQDNNSKSKTKKFDSSLNAKANTKGAPNASIIDNLNLTQPKAPKNKNKLAEVEKQATSKRSKNVGTAFDVEDSSDSIDLKLLFNDEESNDSGKVNDQVEAEDFIPLRNSKESTDPEKLERSSQKIVNTSVNSSFSNKKNTLSSSVDARDSAKEDNDEPDSCPIETLTSRRKNSRKSSEMAVDVTDVAEIQKTDEVADIASFNTSVASKKKKKNVSFSDSANESGGSEALNASVNIILNKEKKKSLIATLNHSDALTKQDASLNLSLNTSLTKKKKKSLSESNHDTDAASKLDATLNSSVNTSLNNKKKKSLSESANDSVAFAKLDASLNSSPLNKKKKKSLSESANETDATVKQCESMNVSLNTSLNKRNNSLSESAFESGAPTKQDASFNSSLKTSSKKSKIKSLNGSANECDNSIVNLNQKDAGSSLESEAGTSAQKTKKRNSKSSDISLVNNRSAGSPVVKQIETQSSKTEQDETNNKPPKRQNKRKRSAEETPSKPKVLKGSINDGVNVSRLPSAVLEKLADVPNTRRQFEPKIVSTSNFVIEETTARKNKPSAYLEDSVYLNSDSPEKSKRRGSNRPKVLPFMPSVATSNRGYTTNFIINTISSQKAKFIAQTSNVSNFKNDHLTGKKIKRMGTYELLKRQRIVKLTKF